MHGLLHVKLFLVNGSPEKNLSFPFPPEDVETFNIRNTVRLFNVKPTVRSRISVTSITRNILD